MDQGWEENDRTKGCLEQCRSSLMIPNERVEMGYEKPAGYTVVEH